MIYKIKYNNMKVIKQKQKKIQNFKKLLKINKLHKFNN